MKSAHNVCSSVVLLAVLSTAAAGLGLGVSEASAQDASSDDDAKPIVFIVLDTSGSMNKKFGDGTLNNSTRMTEALAELVGRQKAVGKDLTLWMTPADARDVPYPIWQCDSSVASCDYNDDFKRRPKISEPVDSSDPESINIKVADPTQYYDDGVIQSYKKSVKFGFAGMAVGSGGSTDAGSDSPIKQAVDSLQGNVNGILRFSFIWNDRYKVEKCGWQEAASSECLKGSTLVDGCKSEYISCTSGTSGCSSMSCPKGSLGCSCSGSSCSGYYKKVYYKQTSTCSSSEYEFVKNTSDSSYQYDIDLDAHCIEDYSHSDKPSRSAKSNCDNAPRYDNMTPGNSGRFEIDYYQACKNVSCKFSPTGGQLDVDIIRPLSSGKVLEMGGAMLGVENITWDNDSEMRVGDRFTFFINPYSSHGVSNAFGFSGELAFTDEDGCKTLYSFSYDTEIGNYGHSSSCSYHSVGSSANICSYDIYVATVEYVGRDKEGNPRFTLVDNAGGNLRFKKMTGAGDPDYIYGYDTITNDGVTVGRKDIHDKYKKGFNCSLDVGMWDSNPNAAAPLIYPTPYNSDAEVIASNESLIKRARSYVANASTPIGEVLADLYYMFGADSDKFTTVDHGLIQIPTPGGVYPDKDPAKALELSKYLCSKKAVIFITDGAPSSSGIPAFIEGVEDKGFGHGHADYVWYDAENLYKRGIKVYTVGYAEFADTEQTTLDARLTLNKMAWKGGTCRDKDNNIISFDDEAAFNRFWADAKDDYRKDCFYNAGSGNALRQAISSVLAEMTRGIISKTKLVTSTALGYVNNVISSGTGSSSKTVYNNGYYSVHSGYEKTLGSIRRTKLQRDTTVCNHETANFETRPDYLDFAGRLACQLIGCANYAIDKDGKLQYEGEGDLCKTEGIGEDCHVKLADSNIDNIKAAGYSTPPRPCANGGVLSSSTGRVTNSVNSCLDYRYIFAGNYSNDRYKLYPDNVRLKDDEFGVIENTSYNVSSSGTAAVHTKLDLMSVNPTAVSACNTAKTSFVRNAANASRNSINYMLSPFECTSDEDCGRTDGHFYVCDVGRCVDNKVYDSLPACSDNVSTSISSSQICIAGRLRTFGDECTSHRCSAGSSGCKGCDDGKVCHAGMCVPGIVKDCDIRQFAATQPLGTIEYATPVIVEPPTRSYQNASYNEFASKYWLRDSIMLAAANDGMLHAFILGKNQAEKYSTAITGSARLDPKLMAGSRPLDEGDELWAFMPKAVMPKTHSMIEYGDTVRLNASPAVADVAAPKSQMAVPGVDTLWRTVAVGGFGMASRGYYALDITAPGAPRVLWEIDNQWSPKNDADGGDILRDDEFLNSSLKRRDNMKSSNPDYPFAELGYTTAEPLIVNLEIVNDDNESVIEPVAILPGGTKTSTYGGHVFYIVRLFPTKKEDLLVAAIYTYGEITGSPAVYPNSFNSIAQRLYFGDREGNFYAFDLMRFNPKKFSASNERYIKQNVKFDEKNLAYAVEGVNNVLMPVFGPKCGHLSGNYEGISFKPAVSKYDNNDTIMIAFGTGSNDTFSVSSEHNYFAQFLDKSVDGMRQIVPSQTPVLLFNASSDMSFSGKGSCSSNTKDNEVEFAMADTVQGGLRLDPRQKMTGNPVTFNFTTYFPTYISSEDACLPGKAAIFKVNPGSEAMHVMEGRRMKADTGAVQNASNSDAYNTNMNKYVSVPGAVSYMELKAGTKIYGLEISRQLYCARNDNAPGKNVAPQLIAQTGESMDERISTNSDLDSASTIASLAINLDAMNPSVTPITWASSYE